MLNWCRTKKILQSFTTPTMKCCSFYMHTQSVMYSLLTAIIDTSSTNIPQMGKYTESSGNIPAGGLPIGENVLGSHQAIKSFTSKQIHTFMWSNGHAPHQNVQHWRCNEHQAYDIHIHCISIILHLASCQHIRVQGEYLSPQTRILPSNIQWNLS